MSILPTRLEVRLDENTQSKLDLLVAKTGKTKTEVIKDLINNARASDFKMIAKSSEEANREIELVSTRKYLNFLMKNIANNLNQIAKQLNISGLDSENKEVFLKAFSNLENAVNETKEKVKQVSK